MTDRKMMMSDGRRICSNDGLKKHLFSDDNEDSLIKKIKKFKFWSGEGNMMMMMM